MAGAGLGAVTRIGPLIASSPVLRDRVVTPRSRDAGNSLFRKSFPGGQLVMTGANSAIGLRSTPVRYLFLDKVAGYPGEGDPVALAIQRTATFKGRRKILMASTPTPGEAHDALPCRILLDAVRPNQMVLADHAYDADWIR